MMLEVKKSDSGRLSKSLMHFYKQLNARYVFQVAFDLPYLDVDCFNLKEPKMLSTEVENCSSEHIFIATFLNITIPRLFV